MPRVPCSSSVSIWQSNRCWPKMRYATVARCPRRSDRPGDRAGERSGHRVGNARRRRSIHRPDEAVAPGQVDLGVRGRLPTHRRNDRPRRRSKGPFGRKIGSGCGTEAFARRSRSQTQRGEARMPQMRLARGQYRVDELLQRFGPDIAMPDLRHELAQCPNGHSTSDPCLVEYVERPSE